MLQGKRSVPNKLLNLACDLDEEGNRVGSRTTARMQGCIWFAERYGFEIVTAAGFSPKHPRQRLPMSTMMADWLREHTDRPVVDLRNDEVEFNTRGEYRSFVEYVLKTGCDELAIGSAWWHIEPRGKRIFRQMYGELADKVIFVPTEEDITTKLRLYERAKLAHAQLPSPLRSAIERAVRATGVNPSW